MVVGVDGSRVDDGNKQCRKISFSTVVLEVRRCPIKPEAIVDLGWVE